MKDFPLSILELVSEVGCKNVRVYVFKLASDPCGISTFHNIARFIVELSVFIIKVVVSYIKVKVFADMKACAHSVELSVTGGEHRVYPLIGDRAVVSDYTSAEINSFVKLVLSAETDCPYIFPVFGFDTYS